MPLPLLTVSSSLTGGSAPAVARITAGRQSDYALMVATIATAQQDPSNATLITNLLSYAAAAGAKVFGFFDSVADTIWGIKPYQGADPGTRPVGQGVAAYLADPMAYPATPLPPPAVSLSAFSLSATALTATEKFIGSVTINAAQSTDTTVAVGVDQPQYFLTLPSSVVVPAGQTSATFSGQVVSSIAAPSSANVVATISYQTLDVAVTLLPFVSPFSLNMADSRASACVAFYPFYEGTGSTIHDCGPNGLHLGLQGSGTIGTDALWLAGPGSGTAGAGQFAMRIPNRGGYFSVAVAGVAALSQSAVSAILMVMDNQDPTQGAAYDQGTPVLQWFASGHISDPICRTGGGNSFVSQIDDPSFPSGTLTSPWFANPNPAAWAQHAIASGPSGATYCLGTRSRRWRTRRRRPARSRPSASRPTATGAGSARPRSPRWPSSIAP